jgi:hypothetical protein
VTNALLSSRAVVKIAGADAASFLQGIVTQDMTIVAGGKPAFGALLTPQGKILFDFLVVPAPDGVFLDCAAAFADELVKRLNLYRLRAPVVIERATDLAAAWGDAEFPRAAAAIAFDDPRLAGLGRRAVGPAAAFARTDAERDYDRRRLALGVPEFGKDFGADEVFLLDVNYDALNGVSYTKGCFVGQEVTSRMKRKGEIRRRTLIARFDGEPPPKGTPIAAAGSTLGEVLSGQDGIALALIRLDRLSAARAAGAPIEAGKPLRIEVPDWLRTE